jgi:hypothetical protein
MMIKPPRNYARLAATVVVTAVVIGAGTIASSYFRSGAKVTKTGTSGPIMPCSDQVWNASNSGINSTVPVLLMRPESTAYICVTYQSRWGGNSSLYASQGREGIAYKFSLFIGTYHCVSGAADAGCTEGWTSSVSRSFEVAAFPDWILLTPYTDHITVVYTVRALSNSAGFYDNSAPYGYCGAMPMAVGFSPSMANASDFPGYHLPWALHCLISTFTPSAVSVGGMNMTYITF